MTIPENSISYPSMYWDRMSPRNNGISVTSEDLEISNLSFEFNFTFRLVFSSDTQSFNNIINDINILNVIKTTLFIIILDIL